VIPDWSSRRIMRLGQRSWRRETSSGRDGTFEAGHCDCTTREACTAGPSLRRARCGDLRTFAAVLGARLAWLSRSGGRHLSGPLRSSHELNHPPSHAARPVAMPPSFVTCSASLKPSRDWRGRCSRAPPRRLRRRACQRDDDARLGARDARPGGGRPCRVGKGLGPVARHGIAVSGPLPTRARRRRICHGRAGRKGTGLVDEALGIAESSGDRWYDAELHRLHGDCCRARHHEREASFQRASTCHANRGRSSSSCAQLLTGGALARK
jgi:hypothetical protein